MAIGHLLDSSRSRLDPSHPLFGVPGRASGRLAHLVAMDTDDRRITPRPAIEPIYTLAELAAYLCVPVQTIYDLRSKGRGPTGFRVGRQLRFRQSEIDVWLVRLEATDHRRHHPQESA